MLGAKRSMGVTEVGFVPELFPGKVRNEKLERTEALEHGLEKQKLVKRAVLHDQDPISVYISFAFAVILK